MKEIITTEDLDIIISSEVNNTEELIEEKFLYVNKRKSKYVSNIKVDVTTSNGGWNDCYIKIYKIPDIRKPNNELLRLCIIPGFEQVVIHKRNGAHGANPNTKSITSITKDQAEYYNQLLYTIVDPSGTRIIDLIANEFKSRIKTEDINDIKRKRSIIDERLLSGQIDIKRAVGKPARGL